MFINNKSYFYLFFSLNVCVCVLLAAACSSSACTRTSASTGASAAAIASARVSAVGMGSVVCSDIYRILTAVNMYRVTVTAQEAAASVVRNVAVKKIYFNAEKYNYDNAA